MIYIDDHDCGYLLNESLLHFTNSRRLGISDSPADGDIVLHARYLHNSTRFKLLAGSTDAADMAENTNERGVPEAIGMNQRLRRVLAHPNGYLFLCNTWEYFPIFSETFQASLVHLMQHLGIPPQRVIVSCCDASAPVSSPHLPIKAFGFDWVYLREKLNSGDLPLPEADTDRHRHFIFLNRRFTEDRFILFSYILAKRYQDRCHLSFLSPPPERQLPAVVRRMAHLPSLAPFMKEISALLQDGLSRLPLELDGSHAGVEWAGTETIAAYARDAVIFLLGETLPQSEGYLFLSEKIYKPIRLGMPFIVYGGPGTLAHLRRLGFRTFHPHIDERYDEEADHDARLELVLREIDRLCRMDDGTLRILAGRLYPIAAYNLGHLKNTGKPIGLEDNLRRCIERADPGRQLAEGP